jgi:hypothetical protein
MRVSPEEVGLADTICNVLDILAMLLLAAPARLRRTSF